MLLAWDAHIYWARFEGHYSSDFVGGADMYRLYIDETGNSDMGSSDDPNHRYLSLTGVFASREDMRAVAIPRLSQLKELVPAHDPDEPIILHRKHILQKRDCFSCLRDVELEQRFNEGLLAILRDLEYRVVTVVIDKQAHLRRYNTWRADPYHYCLEVLVERYALWLNSNGQSGDVLAEVRGKDADKRLRDCYNGIYERGSSFVRQDVVQRVLTSNKLKLKRKEDNIAGLQLADIIAHPSAQYVRSAFAGLQLEENFGSRIVELLLDHKYNRSWWGRVRGYGIKWLP